jgi:hypothetical protein
MSHPTGSAELGFQPSYAKRADPKVSSSCYVGMVYGPVGAFLAEFFPGGGLVPFITSAAFAATGSIGYALIYPIVVPAVCFVLAVFIMPETRKTSI